MQDILDKIKKIEALIMGATSPGEKKAAMSAKDRILKKYPNIQIHANAQEYSLYTPDSWHKKLLIAICRKYGVRPYRYKRQKYTTVMVNINPEFLNEVLWKEFLEYSKHLEELVTEVTDNLIKKIHDNTEGEDIVHGKLT